MPLRAGHMLWVAGGRHNTALVTRMRPRGVGRGGLWWRRERRNALPGDFVAILMSATAAAGCYCAPDLPYTRPNIPAGGDFVAAMGARSGRTLDGVLDGEGSTPNKNLRFNLPSAARASARKWRPLEPNFFAQRAKGYTGKRRELTLKGRPGGSGGLLGRHDE